MSRRAGRVMVSLAAAVLAFGCRSDDEASTNPTIPPPSTVGIGEKVTLKGGETVQVFGYEAGVASDVAPTSPTDVFSVIDVEACRGGGDDVDATRFRLLMPDNSRVTPSNKVAREPSLRGAGQPGQCSRGTVTFELRADRKPESVSYVATDTNIRWRLA